MVSGTVPALEEKTPNNIYICSQRGVSFMNK